MFWKSSIVYLPITCPHCDHVQLEPENVISTICRQCNCGIFVHEGHSVRKQQRVAMTQPARVSTTYQSDIRAPKKASAWKRIFQSVEMRHANHLPHSFSLSLDDVGPRSFILVRCHHCEKTQRIRPLSGSAHCLHCGQYLMLQDYQIDTEWQKRIHTCGNVHITKNAQVHGAFLSCHNLLCEGTFHASANCTGEARFRHLAKIIGTLHCQALEIESSILIESPNAIHTHSALIMGRLHGSIIATGGVTLEKNATVIGDIKAANILIRPGARHQGSIQIVKSSHA